MRIWKRSELTVGQRLIISPNLLSTGDTKQLLKTVYEGETEYGLILQLHFKQGVMTNDPESWHYRRFVDWNSIYCGDTHIRTVNGEEIRAERLVAYE